ncbi:MAG: OmpA family protein [Comamonas sp.]|nr:OmpA family protein [uncultured Comamonas sp.]
MSQPSDDVQPPLLTLVFSAALIALTVSYSVDAEPLNRPAAVTLPAVVPQFAAYEPPTLAASAIVLNKVSAYRVEQGLVKFFFAPGRTELVYGADDALKDIVVSVQNGQRIQISGFHDETGDPLQNTELAKKRAIVVQKRLIDLGAPEQSIVLKKPAVAVILGSYAEARRVEVTLVE